MNKINSLIKDKDMLAENIENWKLELRAEGELKGELKGRQEGELKGLISSISTLVQLKFGKEALVNYKDKLEDSDEIFLSQVLEKILTVNSIDELFQ